MNFIVEFRTKEVVAMLGDGWRHWAGKVSKLLSVRWQVASYKLQVASCNDARLWAAVKVSQLFVGLSQLKKVREVERGHAMEVTVEREGCHGGGKSLFKRWAMSDVVEWGELAIFGQFSDRLSSVIFGLPPSRSVSGSSFWNQKFLTLANRHFSRWVASRHIHPVFVGARSTRLPQIRHFPSFIIPPLFRSREIAYSYTMPIVVRFSPSRVALNNVVNRPLVEAQCQQTLAVVVAGNHGKNMEYHIHDDENAIEILHAKKQCST